MLGRSIALLYHERKDKESLLVPFVSFRDLSCGNLIYKIWRRNNGYGSKDNLQVCQGCIWYFYVITDNTNIYEYEFPL